MPNIFSSFFSFNLYSSLVVIIIWKKRKSRLKEKRDLPKAVWRRCGKTWIHTRSPDEPNTLSPSALCNTSLPTALSAHAYGSRTSKP